MATTQNTPRQNYGNPFSAGSSVAQGAALASPGFVDYSKFFDTSATPGLQAAQQGLFTQIAIANETHAKNMENILPADFDETQLAPGSVDGTYEMLRGLKDQAFNLSRQASNLRGTKEGDMAQMELNKIKSQMSKHYGNNVEYNSMMIDHGKNKDYYSQSFNVIPGKAEEYQRYVKFVDPSAKVSYDGKKMMVTAEDGEKISFEELKKLEPAMQETEAVLGIDQLATTIVTEAGNGKKVNDATIDFTVASIFNKAYQEGGDRLNVLTSLATDMSKEVGGQKFDFYGYVTSDPDLARKYLNSDGSFNIPEDPSVRAEYAKNFESDFKDYLKGTMQAVRDSGIEAYTNDVRAEEERKANQQIEIYEKTVLKNRTRTGAGSEINTADVQKTVGDLATAFKNNNLTPFATVKNQLAKGTGDRGIYAFDTNQDEEGVATGTFGLNRDPGGTTPNPSPANSNEYKLTGTAEEKKSQFKALIRDLYMGTDFYDAITTEMLDKVTFEDDVKTDTEETKDVVNIQDVSDDELRADFEEINTKRQNAQGRFDLSSPDGQTWTMLNDEIERRKEVKRQEELTAAASSSPQNQKIMSEIKEEISKFENTKFDSDEDYTAAKNRLKEILNSSRFAGNKNFTEENKAIVEKLINEIN